MAQCLGITRSGTRCRAQAMSSSDHCYYHAPELEGRRRANNQKGGRRGGRARPLSEVARIQGRLEELAEQVMDKEADRADAAVAGQLYNYALRAISVSLKAKEQEELTERLEQLEEHMERQRRGGNRWGAF